MTSWKISSLTNRIRQAFTDAADQYDILTSLHKEIGRELVKKHTHQDAASLLDVGTGTGYVAGKLKFFFPESLVVGLDLSEGMLDKAQEQYGGISWMQGDAQALPFAKESFNLVFSNLAYQWIADLPLAFKEVHRVLAPKGSLNCTLFGFKTCEELFTCLDSKDIIRLPTQAQVESSLQKAGFTTIKTDYELIKVEFKDVFELLGWLKKIGANRLNNGIFLGKQKLQKVNERYRQQFPYNQGICASFEVIWVSAQK
jgi:malonyl-CoA O-methyltransferase